MNEHYYVTIEGDFLYTEDGYRVMCDGERWCAVCRDCGSDGDDVASYALCNQLPEDAR